MVRENSEVVIIYPNKCLHKCMHLYLPSGNQTWLAEKSAQTCKFYAGKSLINGPFSIDMFDCRRVYHRCNANGASCLLTGSVRTSLQPRRCLLYITRDCIRHRALKFKLEFYAMTKIISHIEKILAAIIVIQLILAISHSP